MRSVYLASVYLHILAAATWIGGMVVLAAVLIPYVRNQDEKVRAAFVHAFGRRFQAISWTCFAILAVSGIFNLWARGVRLGDLLRPEWRGTPFGHLVLVKAALVALVVTLSVLHERTAARPYARWLGRSLLLLGLVIVGIAVVLVRTA